MPTQPQPNLLPSPFQRRLGAGDGHHRPSEAALRVHQVHHTRPPHPLDRGHSSRASAARETCRTIATRSTFTMPSVSVEPQQHLMVLSEQLIHVFDRVATCPTLVRLCRWCACRTNTRKGQVFFHISALEAVPEAGAAADLTTLVRPGPARRVRRAGDGANAGDRGASRVLVRPV